MKQNFHYKEKIYISIKEMHSGTKSESRSFKSCNYFKEYRYFQKCKFCFDDKLK